MMARNRKDLEAGTHRYTMPSGLTADTTRARAVDGPADDDPRVTYAVPLFSGETLVDYQQHRASDLNELEETVRWVASTKDDPKSPRPLSGEHSGGFRG
jgi:hypothetical protein